MRMQKLKKILKICAILLLLAFGLSSFFLPAENLQIRIFAHLKLYTVQVNVNNGSYRIIGDDSFIGESAGEAIYVISLKGDSLDIKQNDKRIGTYKYIKFAGTDAGELRIKLLNPDRKLRNYQNNLSFSVNEENIRVINEVILDNYIAGVTEAEAGSRSSLEFY